MFGDLGSFHIINNINKFYSKINKAGKKSKIIFCIPSTLIYFFTKKNLSKSIFIGGQNCHFEKNYGPFTGSLSAKMLKRSGAKYVIIGHSDNRAEGDSNNIIKKKIESALDANLKIIFCIGESLQQKNKRKTFLTLKNQIKGSVSSRYNPNKMIIAYEPLWSIGTGKVPNSNELRKIFRFIKIEFKKIFRSKSLPPVLYGGSVNAGNIKFFSKISEIDGFLIGGASQSSKKFIDIIKNYYK